MTCGNGIANADCGTGEAIHSIVHAECLSSLNVRAVASPDGRTIKSERKIVMAERRASSAISMIVVSAGDGFEAAGRIATAVDFADIRAIVQVAGIGIASINRRHSHDGQQCERERCRPDAGRMFRMKKSGFHLVGLHVKGLPQSRQWHEGRNLSEKVAFSNA